MPLTISEMFGMALRQSPISKIKKALAKCEAAGLSVTAKDLEAHHLCGRDPMVLADALVTAKELGVVTTFQEMSAVCLVGKDPMEILLEASKDRVAKIDSFSPRRPEKIRGFTRSQQEVSALITIVFRLSPNQVAFNFDLRHVHERIGAAASVFINTSPDLRTLQTKKAEHEAELMTLGRDWLPGLHSLTLEYR